MNCVWRTVCIPEDKTDDALQRTFFALCQDNAAAWGSVSTLTNGNELCGEKGKLHTQTRTKDTLQPQMSVS